MSVTSLGLTGVELDTRLMVSVPGAVLSSSREQGWMVVPNFLSLGITLTGVPVMWLLTPGLLVTLVNTGLFSPALRVYGEESGRLLSLATTGQLNVFSCLRV